MGCQSLVYRLDAIVLLLFYSIEKKLKSTEFRVYFWLVGIIDNKSNGQDIKHISLQGLSCFLDWLEYLIFLGDAMVSFKVID
jgi:hypothetical protein